MKDVKIEAYVKDWGDRCVGEFRRCYAFDRDEFVYLGYLCRKGWAVPSGATHVSVNCTEDHSEQTRADFERERNFERLDKGFQEAKHTIAVMGLTTLVVAILLCCTCCTFGYRWVVRPYTKALRDANREVRGLMDQSDTTPPPAGDVPQIT
eukprot:CAMPEP_0116864436 /NCGR_PEP_ID=MMETSP0418-20121206/24818_1 /TAXON_ID=1158023 /ORGANISM="Astrosyne radiata, Strain 13vi08-1A" /LENGTH=150 /DNA_ID=CAMNT_0004499651 /DNA_START=252 /DNA_END=704 /DNA_ORIENTATION=+